MMANERATSGPSLARGTVIPNVSALDSGPRIMEGTPFPPPLPVRVDEDMVLAEASLAVLPACDVRAPPARLSLATLDFAREELAVICRLELPT